MNRVSKFKVGDTYPAFPSASGMSLRDFFAGMALTYFSKWGHGHEQKAAQDSYVMADAMLEERKVKHEK